MNTFRSWLCEVNACRMATFPHPPERHPQTQLAVSTSELQKARDRVFKLELETQHLRSRPSHVVMRSDPGMVAEATRVWDRATTAQDQARLAQRAAFEACEAVGRETAKNHVHCDRGVVSVGESALVYSRLLHQRLLIDTGFVLYRRRIDRKIPS